METKILHQINITKYNRYKDLFNIKGSIILSYFEQLLYNIPCRIECSHKIRQNKIFSKRINMYFKIIHDDSFKIIQYFIKEIQYLNNVTINRSLFDKVFQHIDINKVKQIIFGIDLRDSFSDSRLKYWLVIENYPDKLRDCLEIHGYNDSVLELVSHTGTFLIGIDFYFNGTTKMKIYPMYDWYQWTRSDCFVIFQKLFCDQTMELMGLSKRVFISFYNSNFIKIVHFFPTNLEQFLKKINNPFIYQIDEKYQSYRYSLHAISLSDEELRHNNIKEINLYY